MLRSILTQPLLTFLAGLVMAAFVFYLVFNLFAPPNRSLEGVDSYRIQLGKVGASGIEPGSIGEATALENIKNLLKGIGDSQYVRDNTLKVYAADDVARSGNDYYIRWTMVFAAPVLSGGQPVHSIGISQIRLNREGKVEFHQDFWDSGKNFFAHLPVVNRIIGLVRNRLESN